VIGAMRLSIAVLLLLFFNGDVRRAAPLHLQIVAGGKVVWSSSIGPGEAFDLAYEHSQEHSIWIHHYVALSDGGIYQTSSTFSAFGAGMPLRAGVVRTPAGFTVEQSRRLGTLRMFNWRQSAITLKYRGNEILIGHGLSDFEPFVVRLQ